MEKLPNLIETLSFLKFPDEKHLLHFSDVSDSESDSDSTIKLPKNSKTLSKSPFRLTTSSSKVAEDNENIEDDEDDEDDLLLSCTFDNRRQGTFNDIFTETLTEKYKSPSKTIIKKSNIKSKKSSMKSKKKSSMKSKKKSSMKSKKSSMKSNIKSKKSSKSNIKSKKSFI